MKKAIMGTAISLALASSSAWGITGLQLDPNGGGSVQDSIVLNPGSSLGDMLFDSLIGGLANEGRVYGHNVFTGGDIGGIPGEITIVFWFDATTTLNTSAGFPNPNNIEVLNADNQASVFEIYYDPPAPTVGPDLIGGDPANHDLGTGYADGVLLAEGTISIIPGDNACNPIGIEADYIPMDDEAGSIMSQDVTGSCDLQVLFTDQDDTGYVINDLVGTVADIDLEIENGLRIPYDDALASDVVFGATLDPGSDGENDFTCSVSGYTNIFTIGLDDGDCDYQAQINSTMSFNAEAIPEPTTLALLGAGMGFAGWRLRRRNGKA